jgi:hypothetical protein
MNQNSIHLTDFNTDLQILNFVEICEVVSAMEYVEKQELPLYVNLMCACVVFACYIYIHLCINIVS